MTVTGEEAARFNAVRLDSFSNVNDGELVEADTLTGKVAWKDKAGVLKTVTLGDHCITLVTRTR